ncbi:hypothetical protein G647_05895 [Cladophialophora carrionii CBS 160.54]|uniref:Voltage-gated hydrogen channel 1 n=1 Tax=Cladophialophora carrionii CBS 160.54 TaxID=1279043 RepID=V9D593_9EURO|nr:uncharacterized protein G647_05895 [Cladophialophora carrionii CBS 160.54]ETI21826.1 hypothetical protein G647_05895 [Cladophialophora carrionii CBS 160.54]
MADPERQPLIRSTPNTPLTPLLPSDRRFITTLQRSEDFIACHVQKIHGADSWVWGLRHNLQRFLSSKWGHYFVIVLVAADISCIFADFLVSLHMCEHGGDTGFDLYAWRQVNQVLGYMSLVFSCLFMAELLGSVFAFGFHYFATPFHAFDALVIIAAFAFAIDLVLRAGPLEEAGSIVVVLRLWRIFKIIEEFSSGAEEDQLAELQERIETLEKQKDDALKENEQLQMQLRVRSQEGNANGVGNGFEGVDGYADGHAAHRTRTGTGTGTATATGTVPSREADGEAR